MGIGIGVGVGIGIGIGFGIRKDWRCWGTMACIGAEMPAHILGLET